MLELSASLMAVHRWVLFSGHRVKDDWSLLYQPAQDRLQHQGKLSFTHAISESRKPAEGAVGF